MRGRLRVCQLMVDLRLSFLGTILYALHGVSGFEATSVNVFYSIILWKHK